jgi:hypothetical protein
VEPLGDLEDLLRWGSSARRGHGYVGSLHT